MAKASGIFTGLTLEGAKAFDKVSPLWVGSTIDETFGEWHRQLSPLNDTSAVPMTKGVCCFHQQVISSKVRYLEELFGGTVANR